MEYDDVFLHCDIFDLGIDFHFGGYLNGKS